MTKLIKKHSGRAFLTAQGNWTAEMHQARQVTGFSEALAIANTLKPEGVDLYYCFDDTCGSKRWDFSIPLNHEGAGSSSESN